MDRVYYEVIAGSPAHAFCAQHAAERKSVKQAYADLAKEYGAKGWTEGWTSLRGLIFDYETVIPDGFKKERGRTSDGQDVYTPRLKGEVGKAIAAKIAALPKLPSQNDFASHFGIPMNLHYSGGDCIKGGSTLSIGMMNSSLIGWTKPDEFWVVLPDIDAEIAAHLAKYDTVEPSSWTLPDGLKRSTKARYDLAVAQAKVDEETPA